jgi:hypothetical protein
LVVRAALERRRAVPASFDYHFFIATLRELFSEKDELRKLLDGKIDSRFDDGK